MTTAPITTTRHFDRLPDSRAERRAFWVGASLLLSLILFASIGLYRYIGTALQTQLATNSALERQLGNSDKAITEIKQLQNKIGEGSERQRIIDIVQQQQADQVRLLHFLSREIPPGIQFSKISRNGSTFILQGSTLSRLQITRLMRSLETTALTDAPVLLALTQREQGARQAQTFKIAAKTLSPKTPDSIDQGRPKHMQDKASTDSTRPETQIASSNSAWPIIALIAIIVAGIGIGIWRRRRNSTPANRSRIQEQFAALDPKQIGTWPLVVRLLALTEIALFAALIAWLFIIGPAYDALENAQQRQLQLQDTLQTKHKAAAKLDAARAQIAAMGQTLAASAQRLPIQSDQEKLLASIQQLARSHGLELATAQAPLPIVQEEFYTRRNISIQLTGKLEAISAFFAALANVPQLVILGDFDLVRMEDAAHALRLDATLSALLALDPAQAAKTKKKKKTTNKHI